VAEAQEPERWTHLGSIGRRDGGAGGRCAHGPADEVGAIIEVVDCEDRLCGAPQVPKRHRRGCPVMRVHDIRPAA
jgi:hypothetical protein